MANVSPVNSNGRDTDGLNLTSSATQIGKKAVTGSSVSVSGGLNVAAQEVGTHVDDAAFGVATASVVALGALADETATDSVDEGDAGAVRMTLNRRLITAGQFLDDAAYTPASDYTTVVGAMADETSPDSVNEGDAGALRMTLARNLHIVNVADTATITTVASQDTNITILAANPNRIGATIFNNDTGVLYLKFGATATATTSNTVVIAAGGYYEVPAPVYRGIIDGIWVTSGTGSANVTELT